MNLQFERTEQTTNEWYTPKEIIDALGPFDLDPCAPAQRLWDTAKHHFTKEDDGLSQKWFGRVWLNPPYEQPLISKFVKRLAEHGNGIALLYNRCDNKLFQNTVFPLSHSVMFLEDRICFYRPDGTKGGRPGCGSVLVAFGTENAEAIQRSGIKGTIVETINSKQEKPIKAFRSWLLDNYCEDVLLVEKYTNGFIQKLNER